MARYNAAEHISNAVVRKCYEALNPNKTYSSRSAAIEAAKRFVGYTDEQLATKQLEELEAKAKARKKSIQIAKSNGIGLNQVFDNLYRHIYSAWVDNPLTIKYGNENKLIPILVKSKTEYGHRYPTKYYRYELVIRKGWRIQVVHGVLTFLHKKADPRKGCEAEWLDGHRQHVKTVKGWLVRDYHSTKGNLEEAIQEERERRARIVLSRRTNRYSMADLRTKYGSKQLTWADSINGGNCEPGTKAFCERFNFDPKQAYTVKEVIDRVHDKHCIIEYSTTLKRAILAAVARQK